MEGRYSTLLPPSRRSILRQLQQETNQPCRQGFLRYTQLLVKFRASFNGILNNHVMQKLLPQNINNESFMHICFKAHLLCHSGTVSAAGKLK